MSICNIGPDFSCGSCVEAKCSLSFFKIILNSVKKGLQPHPVGFGLPISRPHFLPGNLQRGGEGLVIEESEGLFATLLLIDFFRDS